MAANNQVATVRKEETLAVISLERDNYATWEKNLLTIFKIKKFDKYLTEDGSDSDDNELRARNIILSSVDNSVQSEIIGCKTAKQMWERIKLIKSKQSSARIGPTLRQFFSIKLRKLKDVHEHIATMEKLKSDLLNLGTRIDDEIFINQIIASISDTELKIIADVWDLLPQSEQTVQKLISRILAKAAELEEKETVESANALTAKRMSIKERKKVTRCAKCGRKGHWARECRIRPTNTATAL